MVPAEDVYNRPSPRLTLVLEDNVGWRRLPGLRWRVIQAIFREKYGYYGVMDLMRMIQEQSNRRCVPRLPLLTDIDIAGVNNNIAFVSAEGRDISCSPVGPCLIAFSFAPFQRRWCSRRCETASVSTTKAAQRSVLNGIP